MTGEESCLDPPTGTAQATEGPCGHTLPHRESGETGWRSHWDTGLLLVLALVWLTVLLRYAIHFESIGDEYDIIDPARAYISGHIFAQVKYPSFSFYLYGLLFKLFGTLDSREHSLTVARIFNYLLFVGNIFLLHSFLKSHFSRLWSLVGATMFTTLPSVIFSALYVKTEGLLLFQLLAMLRILVCLCCRPNALRWHALAAIGAALAVSTKLSPLPFIIYCTNAIYLRFNGTRISLRALLTFVVVFLACVLATWRNLWIFDQVLAYMKKDSYFLPGAGAWNAVTEGLLSDFPYGRYSSFVAVTMPIALGLIGVFFVCSLVVRSIPSAIFWVFGGGNLLSLLIALTVTRLRLPHGFTPHIVFFFVAGLSFLSWLGLRKPADSRLLNDRLAWVLVAASLSQTGWQMLKLPAFLSAVSRVWETIHARKARDNSGLFPYLRRLDLAKANELRRLGAKDPESLREFVSLFNPRQLYIYSSYIDNMCKYVMHPTYRDNCNFFYRDLLPGKTTYRLEREDVIPWGGFILIDPEFRHMRYILFTRSTQ